MITRTTEMDRPYIFCHMQTSLDGKIMGDWMEMPECAEASEVFYDISFGKQRFYRHQGWLSGRVTSDDNFTFYQKPVLKEDAETVPEGDFIARTSDMYYVSIDPKGTLAWKNDELTYIDTKAQVLEVLSGKASNAYKAYLRDHGISYILAGEDQLDIVLLLSKLKNQFKIDCLMLGGGGTLNWSFIQKRMCDEVSIVVSPGADGSIKTQQLFMAKDGLSDTAPVAFELIDVSKQGNNTVWLRYKVL